MLKFLQLPAILLLSLIMLSCSRYTPTPASSSGPGTNERVSTRPVTGTLEASILANINAYRRSIGLSSVQMLDAASQQAYNHSRNMATGRTAFGHEGFSQRIAAIEKTIGGTSASAENVAYGDLSAKEVVNVWLNSPPHRKNIEGNYKLTGIGTYKDRRGTIYFTQIFLRR